MMPQLESLSFMSQLTCLYGFYFVLYILFLKYYLYPIIATILARSRFIQESVTDSASNLIFAEGIKKNVHAMKRQVRHDNEEILWKLQILGIFELAPFTVNDSFIESFFLATSFSLFALSIILLYNNFFLVYYVERTNAIRALYFEVFTRHCESLYLLETTFKYFEELKEDIILTFAVMQYFSAVKPLIEEEERDIASLDYAYTEMLKID